MTAKISAGFDLPPYRVETVALGSYVANRNGFNCLAFTEQPGAKFTSLENAIEICTQWNGETK